MTGIFSRLGRFLREAKNTLTGRRLNEVRAHFDAELQRRLGQPTFAVQDSASRIISATPERHAPLAVVSCMPPAQTGIATASLFTFREAPYPVDIFASYETPADYLRAITDPRLYGTQVRVFHIDTLSLALRTSHYAAQVFVVGNSHHNSSLLTELNRSRQFPSLTPTFVHIHDPCVLHVLQLMCSAEGQQFHAVLERHYGRGVPNWSDREELDWHNIEELVRAGIYGVRALLHDLDVAGIFVNSAIAQRIVAKETPDIRVEMLFHPVFPVDGVAPARPTAGLRIGSFGAPHAIKKTELATAAFEIIRMRDHAARLVIAGYHAGPYAAQHLLTAERGYEVYDSVSCGLLNNLLRTVDVAIQLRNLNFGENSGIVPRLLSVGTPVIVSKIGAFEEYGDAVHYLDQDATAHDLAELIMKVARNGTNDVACKAYVARHSPRAFCEDLAKLLDRHGREPGNRAQADELAAHRQRRE